MRPSARLPNRALTRLGDHAPMLPPLRLLLCALALVPLPAAAQDDCRLCYGGEAGPNGERPLSIEIETDISFSKLALAGRHGGTAEIDAQTGAKRTSGDMMDLGGMPVTGRGRITGEPLKEVRVNLPAQVTMSASRGGTATLSQFTTNLPRRPVLDANGVLEFNFGARISVEGGRGSTYRGRIDISVDYN